MLHVCGKQHFFMHSMRLPGKQTVDSVHEQSNPSNYYFTSLKPCVQTVMDKLSGLL